MTGLLPRTPIQTPWADQAACRGMDPGLMFPARGEDARAAKAVCATCPVRAECLDYALSNGEYYGIWGGKSEKERKSLRRALNTGTGPCPGCGGPSTQAWNQSRAALCVDCRRARQRAASARHRVSRAGELA